MKTSRRGFLQLGAMGTAALTIGSGAAMLTGCSAQQTPAEGFKTLREVDVYFLGALAPAVLTTEGYPGALGKDARQRLLERPLRFLKTFSEERVQNFRLLHPTVISLFVNATTAINTDIAT